jgi:hypothetical protein
MAGITQAFAVFLPSGQIINIKNRYRTRRIFAPF